MDFKRQHGTLLEQAFVRLNSTYGLLATPCTSILTLLQVLERACTLLPRSYKLWKLVTAPAVIS